MYNINKTNAEIACKCMNGGMNILEDREKTDNNRSDRHASNESH